MNGLYFLSKNAHWLLRISIVSVFLYHGTLKFLNLEGFADMLPISYTQVVLVAIAQVGGSFLVIFGGFNTSRFADLATRVGAFLSIPVMIGAIVMVHWGRWNFISSETHPLGGMEFQVVMTLLMLYVVIAGNQGIAAVGGTANSHFTEPSQLRPNLNNIPEGVLESSS